jgi:hypothetical protein
MMDAIERAILVPADEVVMNGAARRKIRKRRGDGTLIGAFGM